MTFNKSALAASISLLTLALAGCGGAGNQDSGTGSASSGVKLSGLVVDPYLAQAKVYIDLNNDGIHQEKSFERFAFTDENGYFSIAKDGTDYCASVATRRHCLDTAGQTSKDAVLRIEGGYDVATGEKFSGSMVLDLDLNNLSSTKLGASNPLTSLYASANGDTAKQDAILSFIDPAATDSTKKAELKALLNKDFMDNTDSNAFSAERFRRALQVHKAVAILSAQLESKYDWLKPRTASDSSSQAVLPSSAGKFVYEAMVTEFALPTGANNTISWTNILINAEIALRSTYAKVKNTTIAESTTASFNTTTAAGIAQRAQALFDWFKALDVKELVLATGTSDADKEKNEEAREVLNRLARVADLAVGFAKKEVEKAKLNSTPITVDNSLPSDTNIPMLKLLTNDLTPNIINANDLHTTTGKGTLLKNKFPDNVDLPSAIANDTSLLNIQSLTGVRMFSTNDSLAGKNLKLDIADNITKERGTIQLFFDGAKATTNPIFAGARQGVLRACVKTEKPAGSTLSDVEKLTKEGTYIEGRWNRLTDYSVNIAITKISDVAYSSDRALIVKSQNPDKNTDLFLFSLDGDGALKSWKGVVSSSDSVPTNNTDCSNTQLPSFDSN